MEDNKCCGAGGPGVVAGLVAAAAQGEGGGGLHQLGARLATLLPPSSLIKCATSGFELLPGMKLLA